MPTEWDKEMERRAIRRAKGIPNTIISVDPAPKSSKDYPEHTIWIQVPDPDKPQGFIVQPIPANKF